MNLSIGVPLVLLVTVSLSGCAAEDGSTTVSITIIPQNHSGKAYQFGLEIQDAQGVTKFQRNYTLGATTHTGPSAKISLPTGTYEALVEASRADPPAKKSNAVIEFTVAAKTKQILVMVEPNETLAVRAS